MTSIVNIPISDWNQPCSTAIREHALHELESGGVLFFPQLSFSLKDSETQFLTAATLGKGKNVSFDTANGQLRGSRVSISQAEQLQAMMQRFAISSNELVINLLPHYKSGLIRSRTSFRPAEIAGRKTSCRKNDTRLHVDSFSATPVQNKRILRVFNNINPYGLGRAWRLGESFEEVARYYLPSLSGPVWGSSQLLRMCHITKSRRSAYDHFMLQLHDQMKANLIYQKKAHQIAYDFPANSTWIAFTDQVSHAAMSGQHLLEQTFYLPVTSMLDQSRSPLRILERLTGRELL